MCNIHVITGERSRDEADSDRKQENDNRDTTKT
jgi:hypothetical protein